MLQQAEWYTTYLDIRTRYPNPRVWEEFHEDKWYCVLTAARDYAGFNNVVDRTDKHRWHVLQEFNPRLGYKQALTFGDKITNANDSRNFDKAWDLLAEAMST